MIDDSNNVHFSGINLICGPYLAIKSAPASPSRADNDKTWAVNEPAPRKLT